MPSYTISRNRSFGSVERSFNISTVLISIHEKNNFAEGSKILLDVNLKIILLNQSKIMLLELKIMSNAAKILIF